MTRIKTTILKPALPGSALCDRLKNMFSFLQHTAVPIQNLPLPPSTPNAGEPNGLSSAKHGKQQGIPLQGKWITTDSSSNKELLFWRTLTRVPPMVSDQRPLCPKGSSTQFTLIVFPAAVSDHVSFEDAGLGKEFPLRDILNSLKILHFCKEQQGSL